MTDATDALADPWRRAMRALLLLRVDPGLGGIALRARAGPVRDAFLGAATAVLGPATRLHPAMDDEALTGGVDLAATLAAGHAVHRDGLLRRDGPFVLGMAERAGPALAARLALALDAGLGAPLIALDEGAAPDETLPPALAARLAFAIDLTDLAIADTRPGIEDDLCAPTATVPSRHGPGTAQIASLARTAAALGVDSPRAGCLAARAAGASAALRGGPVMDDDLAAAAMLVLVPRATQAPEATDETPSERPDDAPEDRPEDRPEAPAEDQAGDQAAPDADARPRDDATPDSAIPDDVLIEAVRALLPDDFMARLAARPQRVATGAGQGARRRGGPRGRPLPARPGRIGAGRIDVAATLRAAAPWQTLRRGGTPGRTGILIRPGDIRLRRNESRSDRLLIFAVDASGSAAATRLAEAKGAVELMLARAYATRDHVALIGFRGVVAEVLLTPTRSLVAAKRQLAALPGGGGTPLAAGLRAADAMARAAAGRGMAPVVALLTDGRANIALDGAPGRQRAAEDAMSMAARLSVPAVVIDVGTRPAALLAQLAAAMGAAYLPLPRADARAISAAVSGAVSSAAARARPT